MQVGEVAAATAGDENFLSGAIGVVDQDDPATATAGLDGAHEARGACSDDDNIYLLRVHAFLSVL